MDRQGALRAKLMTQFGDVRAYYGHPLYAEFVKLLGAVELCFQEELMTVAPERLLFKQGAANQVRVLRDALADPSKAAPLQPPIV